MHAKGLWMINKFNSSSCQCAFHFIWIMRRINFAATTETFIKSGLQSSSSTYTLHASEVSDMA